MKIQRLQYSILASDIAWAVVALPLACFLRDGFHWYGSAAASFLNLIPTFLTAVALWIFIFVRTQLDGFRHGWNVSAVLSQLLLALCFLTMALMAGGYLFRFFMPRLTLAYFVLVLLFGFVSIRFGMFQIFRSKLVTRAIRRVVIVGNGPVAREMALKIEQHPEILCKVVGFLDSADAPFDLGEHALPDRARIVGALSVVELLHEQRVDELIIASPGPGNAEVANIATSCRREGIDVSVVPHPYDLYLSKPELLDIGGIPLLRLGEMSTNPAAKMLKRSMDVLVGFCLLVICFPVLFLAALVLLVQKRWPFTRELRCGELGDHFGMYRLKSDRDSKSLSQFERILQQLSITEMPQLLNVLLGDMSLVGPRPESPDRVKHYSEWQRQRLKAKPGITGLAQVHGLRQQASSDEKTRFDLQYMMHRSLFLDISIVLQTAWTLAARIRNLSRTNAKDAANVTRTKDQHFERILPSAHSPQPSSD